MLNISSSYFYTPSKVNFKGYSGFTDIKLNEKKAVVNNYTTFFRDYRTQEFTKDYILENFPNGTTITEFGCSTGQKPYSLMISLDKHNKDRKYKCKAYDFSEVLNIVKETPMYGLNSYTREEQFLFDDYSNNSIFGEKYVKNDEAKELRETFYKYFDVYKPALHITGERYNELKKLVKNNPNTNKPSIQKAKEDLFYSELIKKSTVVVKANKKAKELVEFNAGDINNIDKIVKHKDTGVIIFENALYHILCDNNLDYEIEELSKNVHKAKNLFLKINRILPQKGLFILGTLASDHIYSYEMEEDTHLAYQDGRQIRVYDSSPVHQALRASGFIPVFYDKLPETTAYAEYRGVYVPSAWQKVRDI